MAESDNPVTEVIPMLPSTLPDIFRPTIDALHQNYRDAIRLAARDEILGELAQDMVTAQLHVDTARFHHCEDVLGGISTGGGG